jgi:hypothetical protein
MVPVDELQPVSVAMNATAAAILVITGIVFISAPV